MAFAPRLSNLVTMSVDPTPGELPPGLLAEYLQSAGTELRGLAELGDRLARVGNDAEALDRLRRETHKIRGSAGSYGFWEASRLAAGMEETAKDWVARPDDVDLDRGSVAQWFVMQLAEALQLEPPLAEERSSRPADAAPPRPTPPAPPPARAGAAGAIPRGVHAGAGGRVGAAARARGGGARLPGEAVQPAGRPRENPPLGRAVTARHFLAVVALVQGVLLAALLILIVLNRWFRLRRRARVHPRRLAVEGVMQRWAL